MARYLPLQTKCPRRYTQFFETRLFYKPDAPEKLRAELSARNYQPQPIILGQGWLLDVRFNNTSEALFAVPSVVVLLVIGLILLVEPSYLSRHAPIHASCRSTTRFGAFVSSSPDSGRIDTAVAEET